MKKLIFLFALIATFTSAEAQMRGNYGTIQPVTSNAGVIYKIVSGTVTPVTSGTLDTLTNTDTGYVRWTFLGNYNLHVDYAVTKISGTVAGTSLLQCSNDGSNWLTITGNTTYCAGCQGASATVTNTTGTKHYHWVVPASSAPAKYWQIQTITSGTMTASYTGTTYYDY